MRPWPSASTRRGIDENLYEVLCEPIGEEGTTPIERVTLEWSSGPSPGPSGIVLSALEQKLAESAATTGPPGSRPRSRRSRTATTTP